MSQPASSTTPSEFTPDLTAEEKRAKRLAYLKEWQVRNKDHLRDYTRRYRALRPAWYKKLLVRYCRSYYLRTKQAHFDRARQRTASKRGAPIADFTQKQWEFLKYVYRYKCAYCGKRFPKKLTRDHVHPLIKGGNDTMGNIVPACRHCNAVKNDGDILCQVQLVLPLKLG